LHDTLLQGFLSASMQVHVAADQLPSDSAVKPSLTRALHLMRQVIDEGRNVVRGLRSTPGPATDLEAAFSAIPEEIGPPHGSASAAGFRVIVKGESVGLHPVLSEEVYRIGREALLNAFRHAGAGQIVMELDYSSSLRLVVRDNGCGIEPQTLEAGRDGHWGLAGMRERADRIGARLRFCSNANAGTEVELTVPGHIAFQDRPKAASRSSAASSGEGGR
jgi:signal transduction histidine kinase